MKALYFTIILSTIIGSALAQAPPGNVYGQPERMEISKSVQIYPNPAGDEFVHVRVENVDLSDVKVSLHNIIGNEMRVEKDLLDENTLRIKVKDLATGYYLIGLSDDKQKLKGMYKFLKL
jgi:hypothetical protein